MGYRQGLPTYKSFGDRAAMAYKNELGREAIIAPQQNLTVHWGFCN